MKKVFLIGDSIRYGSRHSVGYGNMVKNLLAGAAEVYAPDENCRWAQYTLRYLGEWAEQVPAKEIDAVHWNNGLWDVLRMYGDQPLTPKDQYVYMLRRVYQRIRLLFPNARVIFATNTTVIEEMSSPDFTRKNSEIAEYNAAAVELMKELGADIDDLYAVSKDLGREYHADFVHFNETGYEILAAQVEKSIRGALGI